MTERPGTIDPDHYALFLDVDGTLLEIELHPDQVRADARLRRLLERLSERLGGALALISGRTIDALDRIFDPLRLPAAGAHGTELRIGDGPVVPAAHALPAAIWSRLRSFNEKHDGLLLENKPGGASLHYRRAPDLENACRQFMQELLEELRADYRLIDGKMVLELTPVGASKGEAIRALMYEPPFGGRRPVFVGDDTTDEDGFLVVNALGGLSVRVGAHAGSAAAHTLADVDAVHAWLAGMLGGDGQDEQGERALAQP